MKKRFITSLTCIVVLSGGLIAGCGPTRQPSSQPSAVDTQTSATTNPNTLYLLGEDDFAPISFQENGEAMGIAPDVIRETFKRMGYRVRIELVPWKRAQEMVKDGDADGFFSAYRTSERETAYTFPAEPIIIERNVFVVRKNSNIKFDGDISKLSQYGIGTFIGYNTLDKYIESGQIVTVDRSGNINEGLYKLISGDRGVDLIVNTDYIIWYAAKKLNMSDQLKELSPPLTVNPSYLVFSKKKNMTEIAAKFGEELIRLKADGTYERIIKKYINTDN